MTGILPPHLHSPSTQHQFTSTLCNAVSPLLPHLCPPSVQHRCASTLCDVVSPLPPHLCSPSIWGWRASTLCYAISLLALCLYPTPVQSTCLPAPHQTRPRSANSTKLRDSLSPSHLLHQTFLSVSPISPSPKSGSNVRQELATTTYTPVSRTTFCTCCFAPNSPHL